jgi:hypothetical protein
MYVSRALGSINTWKNLTMPHFTDITGLAGVASASVASLLLFPGIARLGKLRLSLLLGAAFVLILIPFGGMPLSAYVRGATGDLSVATLMLLWGVLLKPWHTGIKGKEHFVWLILVVSASLFLYPMALGIGTYDPYRLGYGDPQFVIVLSLVAVAAWFWNVVMLATCIALATLAWAVGWYESSNLWDYLLDPFVSVYALAAILIHMVNAILHKGNSA